jgi:hypothetical protein
VGKVLASDCASFEHHFVFGEGTGFVTENILNLQQEINELSMHSFLIVGVAHKSLLATIIYTQKQQKPINWLFCA